MSNKTKEQTYEEMMSKHAALTKELVILNMKRLTDEECLLDFVMPEQRSISDVKIIYTSTNIKDLRDNLNAIPEEDIEKYYFDDDYNLVFEFQRPQNKYEYNKSIEEASKQHIQLTRNRKEGDLRKNMKGLQRHLNNLEKSMQQIRPTIEPKLNPIQKLNQLVSRLPADARYSGIGLELVEINREIQIELYRR